MAPTSKSDSVRRRSNASQPATLAGGSRIPNSFRRSVTERIDALHSRGYSSSEDVSMLNGAGSTLRRPIADKMIENVLGVSDVNCFFRARKIELSLTRAYSACPSAWH